MTKLRSSCLQLKALLLSSDIDATMAWRTLKPYIIDGRDKVKIDELGQQIENFDYEHALISMKEMGLI